MSVAATSSSSNSLAISGLASGLNWTSIINDMVAAESAPETQMEAQQTTLANQKGAYETINTDLTNLNNDIKTLTAPGFFDSVTATPSNSSVATASAAQGTPAGSYTFNFTKLATDSVQQGNTIDASPISSSSNVSNVVLSSAPFATPITAGTFTVNGQTITVATSDTLQSVFNQIGSATNGAVTASYNSSTDKISLASSSPIVLGSAADTSNFLQVTQLYGNGTGAVTSAGALGAVNINNALSSANLATPITDGGSGNGEFKINGVAISYNASTDSINSILQKIDESGAGVNATFNPVDNQLQLANTTPGDLGISLQDVTGNFLAATGLSGGTFQAGDNLQYSVNGGATQTSESNTVNGATAGLAGLSVTALATGQTTISVQSDTSTIASAINQFVTDYNTAQTYLSSQTATTTNSAGTTSPGLLTGDINVEGIETEMRQLVTASPGSSSNAIQSLNDLGIASSGTTNTLTVDNSTLNAALTNNLAAVGQLFTAPTIGLGTTLGSYLTKTTSNTGVLANEENDFTQQTQSLATSITTLQQKISSDETNMQNEFVAMEDAISTINTQKQYLDAYFGGGSTSSGLSGAGTSSSSTPSSTTSSTSTG